MSLLKTLNSRMEIVQHRLIGPDEICDASCKLATHRVVEKGLEVDIACTLQIGGEMVWESTITFYYQGRFGPPDAAFHPSTMAGHTRCAGNCPVVSAGGRRTRLCTAVGRRQSHSFWDFTPNCSASRATSPSLCSCSPKHLPDWQETSVGKAMPEYCL